MYVASNGVKTIAILQDPDPLNPRREWDNLGTMLCWHRRDRYGDENPFDSSHAAAVDLVEKYVSTKDVFTAIKNGEVEGLRLKAGEGETAPYRVECFMELSKTWLELDFRVSPDLEVIEEDQTFDLEMDVLDSCSTSEMLQMCDKYGDVAILPIYLYDHSMQSISTGSFIGRAHHAEWDSGQIGFIYLDKETAMKEMAEPTEYLKIARMLKDAKPVSFQRPDGKAFDLVIKEQGFAPVLHGDFIRNLYDERLGSDGKQALIDEEKMLIGAVFKKDHTLYVFDEYKPDGSFDMIPVATFNPDLKPLSEENWKKRAVELLESEVKTYNDYITGEVYGYQTFEGLEEVDSCWGFYAGDEDIRSVIMSELGDWGHELEEKLLDASFESEDNFDIDDYFYNEDFPELRAKITDEVKAFITFESETSRIYPFGVSAEDLLRDKDGLLSDIVEELYDEHKEPSTDSIYHAIESHAGVSRELKPKITAADLEAGRAYTAEELVELVEKKGSLDSMIADASARRAVPGAERKGLEQERGRS